MTTASCQRPRVALPVLADEPRRNPQAAITGPRHLGAVEMLRISVTDVCNLRCVYCMPEEGVEWLPRAEILTYEEIASIVRAAAGAGIGHFKLTGGEPTARRDLPRLVEMLAPIPGVADLSLTSNGILLAPMLPQLVAAGLQRLTISLDTLRPERYRQITRGGDLARVWRAVELALALPLVRVKLNVVVMRGINDDEVAELAGLTRRQPLTVRFIEFMPLGRSGLTDEPQRAMVTEAETRAAIERVHGPLVSVARRSEAGVGPANVWQLPGGAAGRIGFISAMSHPFCESCNRLRLTPEGLLRSCLFDGGEVDLRAILRRRDDGGSGLAEDIRAAMGTCVTRKPEMHSVHGNKAMNRIGG